ncbi:hypothetical protein ERO13_A05G341050v2 [Gossypium hirsutum]|nr:hypothetical protein ERO13_A05G341050v2 [Gossypium hirsutum]
MAANYIIKECKMVVFSFPQCDSNGWSWCPQSPLCIIRTWVGTWCGCPSPIMDHNSLYSMANGRDARDGSRKTFRLIPRTRPIRLW